MYYLINNKKVLEAHSTLASAKRRAIAIAYTNGVSIQVIDKNSAVICTYTY